MNSDRLLIFGIPALVAVLVHLLFVFALEGGWTTASPTHHCAATGGSGILGLVV